MDRICGECANYNHGEVGNPCAKGIRYCGYLKENMRCWERKTGDLEDVVFTKVCEKCGRTLPHEMFYITKTTEDKLSKVCRECNPEPWKHRKRKDT